MFRRFLIAVLVLFLVAVVAVDRVGAHVAAHVLAGQLQSDEHLPNRPDVSIGGIPFLTQVFGGKYDDVSATAHDFRTPTGVSVTTLKAHLHGVHIPLSKVLRGSVKTVKVDRVDGTAYISFADLARYLASPGVSVTLSRSSAHAIDVEGQIPKGGRTRLVNTLFTVTIDHSIVLLRTPAGVGGFKRAFNFTVPLGNLPFRMRFSSVTVGDSGITAAGNAKHVTLGS
jgi:hypothetical protein